MKVLSSHTFFLVHESFAKILSAEFLNFCFGKNLATQNFPVHGMLKAKHSTTLLLKNLNVGIIISHQCVFSIRAVAKLQQR